jgi:hypothetical protein
MPHVTICQTCRFAYDTESEERANTDRMCPACESLRSPGMLEKLSANSMPNCFEATRQLVVQLARLAIEYRGGSRN